MSSYCYVDGLTALTGCVFLKRLVENWKELGYLSELSPLSFQHRPSISS